MAITVKDVAKRAGVSPATVSRVCNHNPSISQETRDRVLKAIAELGYELPGQTESASPSVKTIGIVLPPSDRDAYENTFYLKVIRGINQVCNQRQVTSTVVTGEVYAETLRSVQTLHRSGKADGFILLYSRKNDFIIDYLCEQGLLYVIVGKPDDLPGQTMCIDNDNLLAGREAADYLYSLGHRRIGYLGEENTESLYHSLWNLLPEYGLELVPGWMKQGRERFETGGYLRARELLREKELPTAVIAGYDQMAYGAMRAFAEAGLRVPEDISVVGNSSALPDEACPMSLTTIMKPVEQMCVQAVRILRDAMENPKTHIIQSVTFQSKLVIRNSTCPPVQR